METELTHWGIKGMKWGIRRFQNKDGSLTPAGKKRYGDGDGEAAQETTEERRARALKSTNVKEIYENRDVLTTAEIQERINRIDTEARLKSKIVEEPKPTARDFVSKLTNAAGMINDVYEASQKPVFKAVAKALGFEAPEKVHNWEQAIKNIDKMSGDDLKKLADRAKNERLARTFAAEIEKEKERRAEENKQKAEEEASRIRQEEDYKERMDKGGYSKSGDRVTDSKWGSKRSSDSSTSNESTGDQSVNSSTVKDKASKGRDYVSNILALPAPKDDDD